VALFGSGETSPSGQRIFDRLMERISTEPEVVLLETPAGFELNSYLVSKKIADFLQVHLQNHHPSTRIIPARKRGTQFSPDDPQIAEPILRADMVFMGPGSPSYAVKQLRDSVAWDYLVARHRMGAAIALASAASIAVSAKSLPVYEIYKVGDDLHWLAGLDMFGAYGLELAIIPHWNNNDGGDELDTSRCYMGLERFDPLMEMLPESTTILGIDEQSGLILDFANACFEVVGKGTVTVERDGQEETFGNGKGYPLSELGEYQIPVPQIGMQEDVWQAALDADEKKKSEHKPPEEVLIRVEQRETARETRNWSEADRLRDEIYSLGWEIRDTDNGPELEKRRSEYE
jgi:hypothetical protein